MNYTDKPRLSGILSVSLSHYRPVRSALRLRMITGGLRRPGFSEYMRAQALGTVIQARLANEAGPSTTRNIVSRPPISWNALRKGKQRASADVYSSLYLTSTTRRSVVGPTRSPTPVQIRHFHVSRPRYALPLIPATAAILKVSYII